MSAIHKDNKWDSDVTLQSTSGAQLSTLSVCVCHQKFLHPAAHLRAQTGREHMLTHEAQPGLQRASFWGIYGERKVEFREVLSALTHLIKMIFLPKLKFYKRDLPWFCVNQSKINYNPWQPKNLIKVYFVVESILSILRYSKIASEWSYSHVGPFPRRSCSGWEARLTGWFLINQQLKGSNKRVQDVYREVWHYQTVVSTFTCTA